MSKKKLKGWKYLEKKISVWMLKIGQITKETNKERRRRNQP